MGQPVVHFEVIGKHGEKLRGHHSELFGWDFGSKTGHRSSGGSVLATAREAEEPRYTWASPWLSEGCSPPDVAGSTFAAHIQR
jgi:hypothetical protein